MSDQTTPPEGEPTSAVDTPAGTDAPQEQQTTQEVDWQKRYTDLQREFTTTRQQLTDPEYQAQVAQEWLSQQGYTLPEESEPEYEDPTEALRAELEQIKQQLDNRTQEEQRAQQLEALEQYSESKLNELGLAEKDPARDWIVSRAIAMPPNAEGNLDIEGAYQQLQAFETQRQKQWRETKRAPHVPASGQAATGVPSTDDMPLHELTKWARQEYANLSND